jgi:nitrate reductase beta subunit
VCSETCVGRLRYIGLVLYDADRVTEAAATPDLQQLYQAQLDIMLDPTDPEVAEAARRSGIAEDWIAAAARSPVYALAKTYRVALPLHPEYRTMPMVWYVPPLSPVADALRDTGHDGEDVDNLFGAIDTLRIPIEYLAGLFTAGDPAPVTSVLQRLSAMRAYMRRVTLEEPLDESIASTVGMTGDQLTAMYRLLAIAKYDDRYVIPSAYAERGHDLEEAACSLDFDGGPGMMDSGPFGEASGRPAPVSVETFHALKARQTGDGVAHPETRGATVNLLNWDGRGTRGLFPPKDGAPGQQADPEGTTR